MRAVISRGLGPSLREHERTRHGDCNSVHCRPALSCQCEIDFPHDLRADARLSLTSHIEGACHRLAEHRGANRAWCCCRALCVSKTDSILRRLSGEAAQFGWKGWFFLDKGQCV